MGNEDVVVRLSGNVMTSAADEGAEMIVTSCPLCQYNLEKSQKRLIKEVSGYRALPIVYFTQILGLALGQSDEVVGFDENEWDVRPLLKKREV
jgi:heterodisulfide reductase subunit B